MKYTTLLLGAALTLSTIANAQNGNRNNGNGNSISTGDFLGVITKI